MNDFFAIIGFIIFILFLVASCSNEGVVVKVNNDVYKFKIGE